MKNIFFKYYDKSARLDVKDSEYANQIKDLFQWMIKADYALSDITSKIFFSKGKNDKRTSRIIARQDCILAGMEEIKYLLDNLTNLHLSSEALDGTQIKRNEVIGQITGPIREILGYERTILNILQRMSGIATTTEAIIRENKFSSIHEKMNEQNTYIAATRKTDWMWLDKKAVFVGGGLTHRLSLKDEILIKDNHLDILINTGKKNRNDITEQVFRRLEECRGKIPLIEVDNKNEALVYVGALINSKRSQIIIMLDNFSAALAKQAIKEAHDILKGVNKQIIFEVSGGITDKNIALYVNCGADVISLGYLTHSVEAVNISMEII